MDENLKRKFEFVRSDVRCDDFNSIPFISDVESIACACIKSSYKNEGCNLLINFGRIVECKEENKKKILNEFLIFLDNAERVLTN